MPSPKIIGIAVVAIAAAMGFIPGVPALIGGDPPAEDEAAAEDVDALPPAPDIAQILRGDIVVHDDGLTRLIVRPLGPPDAAPSSPPASPTPSAATPAPDPTPSADPAETSAGTPEDDSESEEPSAEPTPEPSAEPAVNAAPSSDTTAETTADGQLSSDATEADDTTDALSPQPTAIPVPTSVVEPGPESQSDYPINEETLEALTGGAVLEIDEQGRPWAVWRDGTRVPLWVAIPDATPTPVAAPSVTVTPTPTPMPTASAVDTGSEPPEIIGFVDTPSIPETSLGHPTMDAIAEMLDVKSIRSLGDGSFAVVLWEPNALDGLPIEVLTDAPMGIATDSYEGYQWALENTGDNLAGVGGGPDQTAGSDVGATEAHDVTTGAGVVIAVIDTGVDFSIPDLRDAQWVNADERCDNEIDDDGNGYVDDCNGWDFADSDATPYNVGTHPHGTHLAGLMVAADDDHTITGIAPGALIMDLNVATATRSGLPAISTSAVAEAIRYAVDNEADIINLALATAPDAARELSAPVEAAIDHARANGVLVVVAAGNAGLDLDATPVWPASSDSPNVVTVGASDPADAPAFFSNHGSPVDIHAPGVLLLSTMPSDNDHEVMFMSGTSQAAAMTSGVAALILSDNSDLTPSEVIDRLRTSADHRQALVGEVPQGIRLNAANALGVTEPSHVLDQPLVAVSGLADASAGTPVRVTIDVAAPSDFEEVDHTWQATFIRHDAGGSHVLVDLPARIGNRNADQDELGGIDLRIEGSDSETLSVELPAGQYTLLVDAVTDDGERVGTSHATGFVVHDTARAPVTEAPADDAEREDAVSGAADAPFNPLADGPVNVGEWEINRIQPTTAPAGVEQLVEIWGWFPEPVYVWFGQTPGTVIRRSTSDLFVMPPHGLQPGTVDLVVTAGGGSTLLRVPRGFTVTEPEPTVERSVAAPEAPPEATPPLDAGGDESAPLDTPTEETSTATGRIALGDDVIQLAGGLRGRQLLDPTLLAGQTRCTTDLCMLG